ncbi:MAG: indolepyruvate oxidoreductase subunit beta family protein [Pseudomonadota bacterium]
MDYTLDRPFTIAMLALGGQGGGVLTQWLVDIAEANEYLVQSTYVAGVAQRTGATVYCVDLFPKAKVLDENRPPIFNLYPVPGSVDLVVTSELAEAGRAIQKGFVTPNVTKMISSSHRVYGINEKSALHDGTMDQSPVLKAAGELAQAFYCFDMAEAADDAGSVISAVILGAIAGSGALPFPRQSYEDAIKRGGRSVDSNLQGFKVGFQRVTANNYEPKDKEIPMPATSGPNGLSLKSKIEETFPSDLHALLLQGALKALDYQDVSYAEEYLSRVKEMMELDKTTDAALTFRLTRSYARILALQMCYEDTIRVADLKTRLSRRVQIRRDLNAESGQPAYIQEYFHPRFEEICDTMPAGIGRIVLNSSLARKLSSPFLKNGKRIHTNKLLGFSMLYGLSKFRRFRRSTLRYAVQEQHLTNWDNAIKTALSQDYDYGVATVELMEMVSGYGDTHQRGLTRYRESIDAAAGVASDNADALKKLHKAAMADEAGVAFAAALDAVAT